MQTTFPNLLCSKVRSKDLILQWDLRGNSVRTSWAGPYKKQAVSFTRHAAFCEAWNAAGPKASHLGPWGDVGMESIHWRTTGQKKIWPSPNILIPGCLPRCFCKTEAWVTLHILSLTAISLMNTFTPQKQGELSLSNQCIVDKNPSFKEWISPSAEAEKRNLITVNWKVLIHVSFKKQHYLSTWIKWEKRRKTGVWSTIIRPEKDSQVLTPPRYPEDIPVTLTPEVFCFVLFQSSESWGPIGCIPFDPQHSLPAASNMVSSTVPTLACDSALTPTRRVLTTPRNQSMIFTRSGSLTVPATPQFFKIKDCLLLSKLKRKVGRRITWKPGQQWRKRCICRELNGSS